VNKQNLIDTKQYNQKQADFYADKLLTINQEIIDSVKAYDYGRANERLKYADEILGRYRQYKKWVLEAEWEIHKGENNE
jgi:hypothetical protein